MALPNIVPQSIGSEQTLGTANKPWGAIYTDKISGLKWNSDTAYNVDDIVIYNGNICVCKTENSDTTFDATKWSVISDGNINNGIIYGFHINSNDINPNTAVTYIEDAVGMTPAYMNYSKGIFDYGSWENAFFMPRPCMLKFDGTVDYYLNPNDYTQKEDGTPSDVADDTYSGNAMMEWGRDGRKIWYKVVPYVANPSSMDIFIANYKADDEYVCYPFISGSGNEVDHFYTPIYNGSNTENKLRSISGKSYMVSQSGTTEISYAQANGSGWYIEQWCDRVLINFLLILMGKSLNTQAVFGNGRISGGTSASSNNKTGLLNGRGLFWGGNTTNTGVKVFGMENWWGEAWRRMAGLINAHGIYKVKMTDSFYDGSTQTGYNVTGDGYINCGAVPSITSIISKMRGSKYGLLPSEGVNIDSVGTYYCDGVWADSGKIGYAVVAGASNNGQHCGGFAVYLSDDVFVSDWSTCACLSYKQP